MYIERKDHSGRFVSRRAVGSIKKVNVNHGEENEEIVINFEEGQIENAVEEKEISDVEEETIGGQKRKRIERTEERFEIAEGARNVRRKRS